MQGFGKVGAGAAQYVAEAGIGVTAVGDQYGAVHAAAGLDIAELQEHFVAAGTVVGFPSAERLSSELLLELDVDLLVPAAVEGVLTGENAVRVPAGIIVEGANGPTTAAADAVFADRGGLVPDILANAGGVIVSYFEWVQGIQAYWWTAAQVGERLAKRMLSAWDSLLATSEQSSLSPPRSGNCYRCAPRGGNPTRSVALPVSRGGRA